MSDFEKSGLKNTWLNVIRYDDPPDIFCPLKRTGHCVCESHCAWLQTVSTPTGQKKMCAVSVMAKSLSDLNSKIMR